MKAPLAVLALWLIALASTFFLVHDRSVFTFLGPIFAICMIGSVTVVRRACGPR
jgi:hypothetical protein